MVPCPLLFCSTCGEKWAKFWCRWLLYMSSSLSDCFCIVSHWCNSRCHALVCLGRPSGKAALVCAAASVSHPYPMVTLLTRIAFRIMFSELSSLLYNLIFCGTICELHACHPNSRHGDGHGLVLLCPSICLAAILWAVSNALHCVVVSVVAASPHSAAFST